MANRGSYRDYLDRYSSEDVPKSTKYMWQKNSSKRKVALEPNQKSDVQSNFMEDSSDELQLLVEESKCPNIQNEIYIDEVENQNLDIHNNQQVPADHIRNSLLVERNKLLKIDNRKCSKAEEDVMKTAVCKCSNITVGEILLMCLQLMIKHSFTFIALIDIFKVINKIFNNHLLPTTKYMLNKLMNVNLESVFYHVLCLECNKYLGRYSSFQNEIKCTCGHILKSSKIGSFFIELDVRSQLQKLFSDKTIVNSLQERFTRRKKNIDGLEDIYDGKVYREYMLNNDLLGNPYNFSYTFNTDGCQNSFHSKVTTWPIYFMINELPDRLRKKNMVLAGLWVSKTEPEMNIFLEPLVNQANFLSSTGFKWLLNGIEITSKLFPIGCCVDSVARCAMLNMKKFNGYHGCTYCDHPGKLVKNIIKYPMQEIVPKVRTSEAIKKQMLEAHENNIGDIEGVWGPSALMNMEHFDLVKGMIVDFMHSCLLGVTELYTTLIFSKSKEKYYVGSPLQLQIINKRLLNMKSPTCIAKTPRSIRERNMWKASDWMSWLLFYSLPCLKGVLKDKYFNNFALFIAAMYIFLEESITPNMLEEGRILLIKFVCQFQDLFGERYMHYNVHLLLHLHDTVANWGPLWAESTFPFETQNKLVLSMKKCNYRIAQQIVNRLLLYGQVSLLQNENFISNEIKIFCNNLTTNRLNKVIKINDYILIGAAKNCILKEEEYRCLDDALDITQVTKCTKYTRMIYNGCRFTTLAYSKKKKTNDSIIYTEDGKYALISNIIAIEYDHVPDVILFVYEIDVTNLSFLNGIPNIHIKRCKMQVKNITAIYPNVISRPAIIMRSNNQYFVSPIAMGIMGKCLN